MASKNLITPQLPLWSKNPINPRLPVGFRFRPTEVELLKFLQCKVLGEPLPCDNVIKDNVDVYNIQHLQNLQESIDEDNVVYVFTKLKRVSKAGGKRFERQLGDLTWKGSDKEKKIKDEHINGKSKNFSLRKSGILLGYNMKEYSLDESTLKNAKEDLKDYVLCSIKMNKSEEKEKFRMDKAEKVLLEGSKSVVKDKYGGMIATSSDNVSIPSTSGTKEISSARLDPNVEPFSQEYQYHPCISPTKFYIQNQYQAHQHDDTNATRSDNDSIPSTSGTKDIAYVESDTQVLEPYNQAYQQNHCQQNISLTEFYPQNQYNDPFLNTVINSQLPLHKEENNASMDFPKPYYGRNSYKESQHRLSNEGSIDPEELDWILRELTSEIVISYPEENLLHSGSTSQFNDPFIVLDQPGQIDSSEEMLTRMVPLAMIIPTTDSKPTVEIEETTGIAQSKITTPTVEIEETTGIAQSKITTATYGQSHKKTLVRTKKKQRKSSNRQPCTYSEDAECSDFGRKLAKTLLKFSTG